MNHPEDWTRDQIDDFHPWAFYHPAFRDHLADSPPNLAEELAGRGLCPEDAVELTRLRKWLQVLPFADQRAGREILLFYDTEFPSLTRRLASDPQGRRLCALSPVLAGMMFQGASVFPARAAKLARELMACLRNPPRRAGALVALAKLFADPANGRFRPGYNAGELPREQLNTLIRSEHLRRAGKFQDVYQAREKYAVLRFSGLG